MSRADVPLHAGATADAARQAMLFIEPGIDNVTEDNDILWSGLIKSNATQELHD